MKKAKKDKNEVYSIGRLSSMSGVSISTLRYYDKENVFTPAVKNEQNGYRYYTREQLQDLQTIRDLQSFGLSLEEIKEFREMHDSEWLNNVIFKKIKAMKDEIKILTDQCRSIESIRSRINTYDSMKLDDFTRSSDDPYPIEMIELRKIWVLSTKYPSRLYTEQTFSDRCLELQKLRAKYNLFSNGPYIAIFHGGYEKQFSGEEADLEVCMPIIKPHDFSCPELKQIGGVYSVGTVHRGSYTTIKNAYDFINDWCAANGYMIDGPAHEYYYRDMSTSKDESEFVTKIYFPRKKINTLE